MATKTGDKLNARLRSKFIPGDVISDGIKTLHVYRVTDHAIDTFDLTTDGPFTVSFSSKYTFPGYKLVRRQRITHIHDLLFLALLQENR